MSPITALSAMTEAITQSFEAKNYSCATFCDLSKAFDTMDYKILLGKMEYYGFRGIALKLFVSYLTDRCQLTESHSCSSELRSVNMGVPQGSVLGPLLFLLYVNDLAYNIRTTHTYQFADDTSFLLENKDLEKAREESLIVLSQAINWFEANKLKLNVEKTKKIFFSLRKIPVDDQTDAVKFLGIYIDTTLNWRTHTEKLCSKLSKVLFMLRRIAPVINEDTRKIIYFACFHSILTYGLLVWGHSAHAERVFKIQKKAVRILGSASMTDSCRPIFQNLGILTLPLVFIYWCLLWGKNIFFLSKTRQRI